ncbi:DMT family transporter [Roseibium hamelinense]|uniref:DMT family transporter n=1 Tax=Roseibium hamelinense TaxID=150831 RepID=UPI0011A1FDD3|nr:DMT family transporter [Roseibium hamelinense]MTI42356.1 DMT family transporter [Roseibium hamelinense]
MDHQDNTRAILAMMLSMAGFILNDALVKIVSEGLPLGQIIFIRGLFAILLIGVACQITGVFKTLKVLHHPQVYLRAFAEVMATVCYLSALFRMPIANATAILQALPLVVTAGAAIFLKVHVGWRRWTAIGVGFSGVLLIVRPGLEGFNAWSLLALAGVGFMALRDIATRRIPQETPTFGVALMTLFGVTLVGGGLIALDGWQPIAPRPVAMLALAAVFLLVGYVFIIIAMRRGEIAVVAPFRYSIVIWAIVLGVLVWGEFPDSFTLVGTFIIVVSGVYTFFREQRLAKARARDAPVGSE